MGWTPAHPRSRGRKGQGNLGTRSPSPEQAILHLVRINRPLRIAGDGEQQNALQEGNRGGLEAVIFSSAEQGNWLRPDTSSSPKGTLWQLKVHFPQASACLAVLNSDWLPLRTAKGGVEGGGLGMQRQNLQPVNLNWASGWSE